MFMQGGLAGTGRAHDGHVLATVNVQINVRDGVDGRVAVA